MKKTIKETRNMMNKLNEVLGEAPITQKINKPYDAIFKNAKVTAIDTPATGKEDVYIKFVFNNNATLSIWVPNDMVNFNEQEKTLEIKRNAGRNAQVRK